jgi:DNA-binding IclR family transcriptional regulator
VKGWKGRSEMLIRALSLLRLLEQPRRYKLQELADRLDCHERTVRRDLYALEAAGYLVRQSIADGERRWWINWRGAYRMKQSA